MLISRWRHALSRRLRRFEFSRLSTGEPIRFTAGQMYGLPSAEGLIFVGIAMVMLLTSSTYSNNLMFASSFVAGALFLVLPSFVYRNLGNCQFEFSSISPIFLGESAISHLQITNPRMAWAVSIRVDGGADELVECIERSEGVSLSYTPQQRGYQSFPPVRVASSYPMNLFNLWGWMKNPHTVMVYPEAKGQPLENFFRLNNQKVAYSADIDLQYWQHRLFQPGDSYSRVDWVKLASMGKMFVREYRPTSDAFLHFDLERTQMPCTVLEDRLAQLCLWINQAEDRGLHYGLHIGDMQLPVERGEAHLRNCLEALACYPDTPEQARLKAQAQNG